MTMLTSGMTSSDSIQWGTPPELFNPLNDIWDFTLDAAASHENAKCLKYCTVDGTFMMMDRHAHPGRTIDGVLELPPEGERWPALTSAQDGLNFPWRGHRVFLNPPWGQGEAACPPTGCTKKRCVRRGSHVTAYQPGIEDFLRKVRNEHLRQNVPVVCILPARTDNGWFHDYVLPYAKIRWVRGRPHFIDPEAVGGKKQREAPPVGILVATYA